MKAKALGGYSLNGGYSKEVPMIGINRKALVFGLIACTQLVSSVSAGWFTEKASSWAFDSVKNKINSVIQACTPSASVCAGAGVGAVLGLSVSYLPGVKQIAGGVKGKALLSFGGALVGAYVAHYISGIQDIGQKLDNQAVKLNEHTAALDRLEKGQNVHTQSLARLEAGQAEHQKALKEVQDKLKDVQDNMKRVSEQLVAVQDAIANASAEQKTALQEQINRLMVVLQALTNQQQQIFEKLFAAVK